MRIEVRHGPANAAALIRLEAGETVTAEAGSMIAMSGQVEIQTTALKRGQSNVLKALKRVLARETFFLNHFTAREGPGEVWLAPVLSGDLMVESIRSGSPLIVRGGSYLAAAPGVQVDMSWQGFRSFFAGDSVFWLKVAGEGPVVLNAFGAIYPVDIDGTYVVDSGHLVAFPENLPFAVAKAGKSWLASILGGEGLVAKFQGKGLIWCQSHNPSTFGRRLGPLLKPRVG